MAKLDLGAIGAVLSPAEPRFVETAVQLELMGFTTIWLTGGPMASLGQVADVIRATERARVGTAIISVDRFPADEVGLLYDDLEAQHPGRFIVGLGGAHGPDPIGTISAYLDRLTTVPTSAMLLAALGPRMLRLARERTSGALPVLVTPASTVTTRAILGDDRTLAVEQLVVLEQDPATARRIARGPLGFLGRLPAYQASFRRMGFTESDIESLSDDLVDGVIGWGGVAPIARRVRAHVDAGADHVAVSVVSESPAPTLDEWRTVAATLLPA
jgi:probable F420-dependent oxidoreductase